MADSSLKEAIRIVLETEGREGIDALRKSLASIGDVSADTVADTDRLLDSLAGLNETAAKATRFGEMAVDLESTTKALDDASRAALQLSLQIAETDKPSKEMLRTYKDVREEVTRLEGVQRKQIDAQAKVGDDLRVAGIDTRNLAAANAQLRTQITGATAALQKQAGVVDQQAEATRRQKQATADADAQFRKMAASGQVSAEALRQYRERAAQAADGTSRLGGEVGRVGGLFSRLRGFIAPIAGFLTFRAAIDGIRNLAGVGAAAENARRALGNLYGTQAQGNKAYAELKDLAKQSGLAFADVLEDAKKLKAFGLDPLNGSYQALVDQNAAVGGTQEDLAGKVLALGQAWAKQKLQGEEILQLVERGVPVWDLLQKSTGKSVTELQKLSAAGKLGRETIAGLYQEIGRANSGAAERSLGGLTGLLSQASARWQEFKQKVADAGVTDYLKRQVQSLLESTGGMDGLAQRVATGIIKTFEALKRFGQQLALVGAPIASATLALARNAEAVLFLGKVYATIKLARFVSGFTSVAAAADGSAGAASRAAQALLKSGAAATSFGTLLGKLPKNIQIGIAVAGLDYTLNSFIKLNEAIDYRREALGKVAAFERAQGELQQEQLRLGQQLQTLYQTSSGVVIESGGRISAMTRTQAQEYQGALEQARQFFGGVIREARASGDAQKEASATERWRALGTAVTEVKDRLKDLDAAAASATGIDALVNKAVAKFDEIASKTGKAKEAVSGIFDGIDLTRIDGLKQATEVIDQVSIRGTAAADAVKAELRTALAGVADKDLPALKAAAEEAFGSGTTGAKLFAAEVDRINLTRLGVDVDAIKSGFTSAGRAAVDGFRGAIDEVDKLGLTVEQRSAAIAQAFDNAFKQASTQSELQALKQSLQDALSAGDIGFVEFQKRIVETDAKLAELSGTGKKIGTDVAEGANQASSALADMGNSARSAADNTAKAGDEAEKTGEKAKDGAEGTHQMAFGLASMSDEAVKAFQALNHLAGNTKIWTKAWNNQMQAVREQKTALSEMNDELDAQLAKFDPLAEQLAALKAQYQFVDDATLRAFAEKKQRLDQETKRAQEEAKRAAEQATQAQQTQQQQVQPAAPEPARANASPAPGAAAAGSSGAVVAVLRLEFADGGNVDLTVPRSQADEVLRELRRGMSVSVRGHR